jgi:hydrogenase maturation protease
VADPPGQAAESADAVVVGLGHPDRGDDAVGPLVVEAVRALDLPGVRLAVLPEPTGLDQLWAGAARVVVVDAAIGGPPGELGVHDLATTPLPGSSATVTSSHGMTVESVVELARQLGRLPGELSLVTVAGVSFELGAAPRQDVLDAVPAAAAQVVRLLGPTGGDAAAVRREGPG